MPRFFFDIRDQDGTAFDEEGIDLTDLAAAISEARQSLADIMRDDIVGTGKGAVSIEIRTGEGRSLVEVVAIADERSLG